MTQITRWDVPTGREFGLCAQCYDYINGPVTVVIVGEDAVYHEDCAERAGVE